MPEVVTPQAPPAPNVHNKSSNPNRKKIIKRVVSFGIAAAVLAGIGFGLYKFMNTGEELGEILAQPAELSAIQSKVSGSGTANPSKQEAIALTMSGTVQVQDVYVNVGDVVTEGQPLYTIFSQSAEDNVRKAQEKLNEQMEKQDKLNVRAPFSGKIMDVKDFRIDDQVMTGTEVAKLVNDKRLKLSLYFSYAYENDIFVGKDVSVSVPAVMRTFDGTVEEINKVSFISPEGAVHFEVVVGFDNPGTLTAGMNASATMLTADGTEIYPYENGKTEFYDEIMVTSEADGPVIGIGNLHNYANVSAGEALLTLGADTLQESIEASQQELDMALSELEKFNAVAPISGTVMSCALTPGEELEIKSGEAVTAITISDNAIMKVTIQVDDRNISFIKPGSSVELNWNGTMYMGTVSNIDMSGAQQGQGMTNFPVTLEVDNFDGSLMGGAWLQYSFVTSESLDCIVVPTSSVQYFSDAEGNRQSVVFVQRDSRPDDVPELELPTVEPGEKRRFPSEDEGYYPVIVETGLSDNQNVEITSGLEQGDMVFVNYMVTDGAGSW